MIARRPGDDELVIHMARDLRRLDAWQSESDAIRSLLGRYAPLDIAMLAGEAREAARKLPKVAQ